MKFSLSACKQMQPLVNFQGSLNMEPLRPFFHKKDKVVFVMGATGTGKSRLAIDLATRFPAEIVNSDKMQVYKGLDIATNKVTEEECNGVPHHLLGIIDPNSYFTATDFRHQASSAIESILGCDRLPIIAGGSNSYIEALVTDNAEFQFRYECCFLWIDVSLPILNNFVSDRVDRMVESGLVEEVRRMFNPKSDYACGIRRAIGVPELDEFFHAENNGADDRTLAWILEVAIDKIKQNTCNLACRQLQKIHRLQHKWNWNMHRLDATEAFVKHGRKSDEAWQDFVTLPSTVIVDRFLHPDDHHNDRTATIRSSSDIMTAAQVSMTAVAAAAATR